MTFTGDDLSQDPALGLGLAVIAASTSPLLLLDADLKVEAASASFCRVFDLDPTKVKGTPFLALGAGEWDVPQLRSLLGVTAGGAATIEAYEFQLKRADAAPRAVVVNAQKLLQGAGNPVRLLVAGTDVTDARSRSRLAEALTHENGLLLKEARHRIANSLQIIASVLLQGARRTQSDEVRGELHNAHHRLMSVATLERQLASASADGLSVAAYFNRLCTSIADSMILHPDRLKVRVETDDSLVPAAVSVSMGLIVTELVINALKHAFPDQRPGEIVVSFSAHDDGWRLAVRDDGVGMPEGDMSARAGLGTSIVHALATQLDATVSVADANPGVVVTIEHVAHPGALGQSRPTVAAV